MAVTLAIDAMGGDHAPLVVFEGLKLVRKQNPDVKFLIFGHQDRCKPYLKDPELLRRDEFIHCDEIIKGTTEPRAALREFKNSSMRRAIEAVVEGRAEGVVSSGNTGAYMVLSKLLLKTLPGISRPAITALMPTWDGRGTTMLDMGANVDVSSEILIQFCIMGQAFSRCVQNIENPRCALLNIGSESLKGTALLKETHGLIQKTGCIDNFIGYVEGDGIFSGSCDVVVTDGFTGNVSIKTAEGTVKLSTRVLKEEINRTLLSRLGALMLRSTFKRLKERLDPRRFNGAQFLGLQGVAVKSHGGTDAFGFYSAVNVTVDLVKNKVNEKILKEVTHLQASLENERTFATNLG